MSINAKWTVSGTKPEDSAEALRASIVSVTNGDLLEKYEPTLNYHFQENISKNLRRAGMEADNFDDVFFLKISNSNISFINTAPLVTQRYEYGYYYDDKNDNSNEEYFEEYMIQTSPKYFIRPSIQESLNEIGQLMINEVNNSYMENRKQTYGDDVL